MSDALSLEQVERWWVSNGQLEPMPRGGLVKYRDYEALRAQLTERAEKASVEFALFRFKIADLTAKLETLTQDRNAYQKIAADWAAAADLSQRADDFYKGYSEKTMRAMQALLTKSQQQLVASEQRVTDLGYEVAHYRHACQSVGETDGHGWAETTKELREQRDQLKATVTAQQEEIGRLREALRYYAQTAISARAVEALASKPDVAAERIDVRRFESAPCYICGHNGGGYYQPRTHPCAALYHAAIKQEGT